VTVSLHTGQAYSQDSQCAVLHHWRGGADDKEPGDLCRGGHGQLWVPVSCSVV